MKLAVFLLGTLSLQEELPRYAPYKGWDDAVIMKAGDVTAIAVPAIAGRLVRYARGGDNILFENPEYLGKTLATSAPGSLDQGYIGYTVDLGPELRRIPRHLVLWMGPTTSTVEDRIATLTGKQELGIVLEKQFHLDPKTGELGVVQTMRNVSDREQSYSLWDRTLCVGGGFAFVKLNPKSRFKSGWCLLRNGVYDGENPEHANVTVKDGILVVEAKGKAAKLGVDSDCGWVAYVRGRQLFIKYFLYTPGGNYSDGGNSLEIYFDPKVCELEPLSPETTLAPGDSYSFPETWALIALERDVSTADEARALVDRVLLR